MLRWKAASRLERSYSSRDGHRFIESLSSRAERGTIVGYTVVGYRENLNFSFFEFGSDFDRFLARYLVDRDTARSAISLRLAPVTQRNCLFVTALPWMKFTSVQPPLARMADASIPNVAIGKFDLRSNGVVMPLSVQAHHGFVDALHVARLVERIKVATIEFIEPIQGGRS